MRPYNWETHGVFKEKKDDRNIGEKILDSVLFGKFLYLALVACIYVIVADVLLRHH